MSNRRDFLLSGAAGFGGLALATMLQEESQASSGGVVKVLHHPPKAKRVEIGRAHV